MDEFLAGVIGALSAGALAKAGDIGGRAVTDAYDGLRALIVRKLGKGGAVQSVEDEPRSEAAQAALAEALTKAGLAADQELAQHAEALRAAVWRPIPVTHKLKIERFVDFYLGTKSKPVPFGGRQKEAR